MKMLSAFHSCFRRNDSVKKFLIFTTLNPEEPNILTLQEKQHMKKNTVKKKLASEKPAIGAWLSLASWVSAEYMAHAGFDWLVVDTEHSPVGFETTVHCFQAICTTDTIPMARVTWNDPILIKRLLDAGAMGLVIPMVNSPEEAEQAVKAMKFPPEGLRSLGGGRAMVYGSDYFAEANNEIAVIVQIEHIEAVKSAQEILAVDGVDACFIGPNDLAGSMGIKPDIHCSDPEHEAAVMSVLQSAKEVGKPAGIHCATTEAVNRRVEQGFQFVAISSDAGMLKSSASKIVSEITCLNQ
ncbi:2-dehydro-3-deoxyglucarate aldolase [Candidatus Poribacteria bacterium]|nr:2-dehydro-3-deoxyglucarate aldolase [Candidatus Poribacteria bacterium]